MNVNISFLCFAFGNNNTARPYNAENILVDKLWVLK